nr:MAG TPA: hypothetical protein [Caudoviricetes sp.]
MKRIKLSLPEWGLMFFLFIMPYGFFGISQIF